MEVALADRLADELADYVWLNALSTREIKSVASSINYRIGFLTFGKKAWLRVQLCFLHAFLGTLALRMTPGMSGVATEPEMGRIVARYTKRLLSRCIPKQMLPKYEARLAAWSEFFVDREPSEAVANLGASFYECLSGKRSRGEEVVLGLRFAKYILLLIGSIENMAQCMGFAQNEREMAESVSTA